MTVQDFLAVLLRDGGHYELQHGTGNAIKEALRQWYRDQTDLDRFRAKAVAEALDERVVTWDEVRNVADSTFSAIDLAQKLFALGFAIEGFPGRH
jgi:hypothetical protein